MTLSIMDLIVILSINDKHYTTLRISTLCPYAECRIFYCYPEHHDAKCRYAECYYAECRDAIII